MIGFIRTLDNTIEKTVLFFNVFCLPEWTLQAPSKMARSTTQYHFLGVFVLGGLNKMKHGKVPPFHEKTHAFRCCRYRVTGRRGHDGSLPTRSAHLQAGSRDAPGLGSRRRLAANGVGLKQIVKNAKNGLLSFSHSFDATCTSAFQAYYSLELTFI